VGETLFPPRERVVGARRCLIYEVFRQERKGQPFQHAGSVEAPDHDFAEAYAREQYARRGESEALWVVPREAIVEVGDFVDELNRNYHRVDGYSLKDKLRRARERAGSALVARDR
jgi:ring-1,2-phenylacetyl-CoA epoxidase subunit PaaB